MCDSAELTSAFAQHQSVFGRLDICINNAGVVEKGRFYEDTVDWRKVMDINLTAVIEGTRLAVHKMLLLISYKWPWMYLHVSGCVKIKLAKEDRYLGQIAQRSG